MQNPIRQYFMTYGAMLLVAAILAGSLHGVWQYQIFLKEGRLAPLLFIGFLTVIGGLAFLLKRLIYRVSNDMDEVIDTVERIGRGELSCSLSANRKGSLYHLCEAINQMVIDLQHTTAPRERLRQEIDDRRAVESALEDSQRLWEKTFNAVPDLITILDKNHRMMKMNTAMAEALGDPEDTCGGKQCHTCVHGNTTPIDGCPHALMLATGKVHTTEYHEPKLGRWLQVRVSPLRDASGAIIGGVHVATDINSHKELEDKLARRNTALQESVVSLEAANQRIIEQQKEIIKKERLKVLLQMAGATAHEMNQPLMALQGNIELLQHAQSDPERNVTYLKRIFEAGDRLAGIVRKIQTLRHDEVRPYPGGATILDIHKEEAPAQVAAPSEASAESCDTMQSAC